MTGLFAACAVVFLGLTVSMALGWSELRGRAGLDRFAAGYGVVVASAALLAGRGRVPDFLTTVVANVLLVTAAALILEGTRLFCGSPGAHAIGRLAVALSVVGFPWLTYVQPSFVLRTILANGLVAVAARGRGLDGRPPPLARGATPGRDHLGRSRVLGPRFGARAALKAAGVGGIDSATATCRRRSPRSRERSRRSSGR